MVTSPLVLPQAFYARPARIVAQALLGQRLVRLINGQRVSGRIVETEAYCDSVEPDLACHGTKNKGRPTGRSAVMFGPPGRVYIYFTYGMHWMFNVVTGEEGQANAVLIRALEPEEGQEVMQELRPGVRQKEWSNGPAKLTRALAINHSFNGRVLYQPTEEAIWIEEAPAVPRHQIEVGPRVGLGKAPEPWFSAPWRYWVKDNPFVSSYR